MKALIIFDGGLAPGYTTVAVGLVEEAEKRGWETWAARSGFRSLCEEYEPEPQLVRVVTNPLQSFELNNQGIPTESIGRRRFHPGSDFRSERFPEFADKDNQYKAVQRIVDKKFDIVVVCGGDGSLKGAKALSNLLPEGIQIGFINISADSDIKGDRSIGFLSCAEHGATIARGLYEDAYTHRRLYFLEMMGNDSGRHALHAGSAACAHLIVLPLLNGMPPDVMKELAQSLNDRRHALVVVAEGYEKKHRKENGIKLNAAQFLVQELAQYGLEDSPNRRVIAEGFSRHLRGVSPLLMDCQCAILKSQILMKGLEEGESNVIAYYHNEHDMGLKSLDDVCTDNNFEKKLAGLLSRIKVPMFSRHVEGLLG